MTSFPVVRRRLAFLFLLLPLCGAVAEALADVVAIYDRGRRIRLEGAEAEELSAIAVEMMTASTEVGGGIATDGVEALRRQEVAVEVKFDPPRELESAGRKRHTPAEYLLVPLTGELSYNRGYQVKLFVGMHTEPVNTLGVELVNRPDAYGISYYASVAIPDTIDRMRAAVAKLGVRAERPTP